MDGVLIIDKPAGMTSHDVVAQVRRILGERRVGHTGTLDPFATGVLVLLVGRATRLARFLGDAEKEYEAVFRLGYATDTGDLTGEKLDGTIGTRRSLSLDEQEIKTAMNSFRGEIEQIPPMYSAKKVAGEKLYERARRGETIERSPVRVTISKFEARNIDGVFLKQNDDDTCDFSVVVACSAGTYVRTLAEDFGRTLGVGAHVAELRRTRAGTFRIEDAVPLDRLGADSILITPDAALAHLAGVDLDPETVRRVQNGIDFPWPEAQANGAHVRLRDESGNLVAVGVYQLAAQTMHPEVVISTAVALPSGGDGR